MVYFIQATEGGLIKIGTTVRLSERLKTLRKESGRPLWVLAVIPGDRFEEKGLHARFSHLRRDGEWFEPGDDLRRFIDAEATDWDGTDEVPKGRGVPLQADLAFLARIVAAFRGVSIGEYIDSALRDVIVEDYNSEVEKEQARMAEEQQARALPQAAAKAPRR